LQNAGKSLSPRDWSTSILRSFFFLSSLPQKAPPPSPFYGSGSYPLRTQTFTGPPTPLTLPSSTFSKPVLFPCFFSVCRGSLHPLQSRPATTRFFLFPMSGGLIRGVMFFFLFCRFFFLSPALPRLARGDYVTSKLVFATFPWSPSFIAWMDPFVL